MIWESLHMSKVSHPYSQTVCSQRARFYELQKGAARAAYRVFYYLWILELFNF